MTGIFSSAPSAAKALNGLAVCIGDRQYGLTDGQRLPWCGRVSATGGEWTTMSTLPLVFDAPRRGTPPRHLADLAPEQRRAAVAELGLPGFRADQLSRHYFGRFEADPDRMTDLPAAVREQVRAALLPALLTPINDLTCDDGTTRKTLWKGHDGVLAESVLMGYPDRATVCVSSQAGCGMACPFCATGQGGLQRNLSCAEIVEQVRRAAAAARDGALGEPTRLSNVVFMGMGEPLANYRRVVDAVRRITEPAPSGLGISARGVTVSTVGLVPAIDRLAEEGIPVTLAVSLHTPDDELRDTLVPVNNRWKVAEVLTAARHFADVTGRRVSIEYALIRDVNDHPWRADLLGRLLRQHLTTRLVHVNLIPLNPTPGSEWDASPLPVQDEFVARVRAAGVACTVRDTRGREIAAACGQLAANG
jgi:23S rRNA (adenine2503-C2)-methyltransferase